jgi:hypothetical protein
MQQPDENILTFTNKLLALQSKIVNWRKRATEGNLETFLVIERNYKNRNYSFHNRMQNNKTGYGTSSHK